VPRLDTPGVEPGEGMAADAISELASDIERLVYYQSGQNIAPATVHELNRCFRVLKRVTEFYLGDNSPLCWTPPDGKFRPKKGTTD
jgi:hypothetical protein